MFQYHSMEYSLFGVLPTVYSLWINITFLLVFCPVCPALQLIIKRVVPIFWPIQFSTLSISSAWYYSKQFPANYMRGSRQCSIRAVANFFKTSSINFDDFIRSVVIMLWSKKNVNSDNGRNNSVVTWDSMPWKFRPSLV